MLGVVVWWQMIGLTCMRPPQSKTTKKHTTVTRLTLNNAAGEPESSLGNQQLSVLHPTFNP